MQQVTKPAQGTTSTTFGKESEVSTFISANMTPELERSIRIHRIGSMLRGGNVENANDKMRKWGLRTDDIMKEGIKAIESCFKNLSMGDVPGILKLLELPESKAREIIMSGLSDVAKRGEYAYAFGEAKDVFGLTREEIRPMALEVFAAYLKDNELANAEFAAKHGRLRPIDTMPMAFDVAKHMLEQMRLGDALDVIWQYLTKKDLEPLRENLLSCIRVELINGDTKTVARAVKLCKITQAELADAMQGADLCLNLSKR